MGKKTVLLLLNKSMVLVGGLRVEGHGKMYGVNTIFPSFAQFAYGNDWESEGLFYTCAQFAYVVVGSQNQLLSDMIA